MASRKNPGNEGKPRDFHRKGHESIPGEENPDNKYSNVQTGEKTGNPPPVGGHKKRHH